MPSAVDSTRIVFVCLSRADSDVVVCGNDGSIANNGADFDALFKKLDGGGDRGGNGADSS